MMMVMMGSAKHRMEHQCIFQATLSRKQTDIYYTNYMYKTSAKLKKMESKTVQTTPAKKGK